MIMASLFGLAGAVAGADFGGFYSTKKAVVYGTIWGGLGAGFGYGFENALIDYYSEPTEQIITTEQKHSIAQCLANTSEDKASVITLTSSGAIICDYAPL
jgi:hypothetical protein